jgi:aldehyde dehydrogenase (NAD+)
VFNLVLGDGPGVGVALLPHRTSWCRSPIDARRHFVVQNAAPTVKRVTQELGVSRQHSARRCRFPKAVAQGMGSCVMNSGQSCNAPTRMLVPIKRMDEAAAIAKATAMAAKVGDPAKADTNVGPVVSKVQWNKMQGLIKKGIEEGAKLEGGGEGLPDGWNHGYFVKPTVFSHVTNEMTIAREEIFDPCCRSSPKTMQMRFARQRHALWLVAAAPKDFDRVCAAWRARSAPATST